MQWVSAKSGFDEIFDPHGRPRPHYAPLLSILESFTREDVERRERLQKLALMSQGITFTVYGEKEGSSASSLSTSSRASSPPRSGRPSRTGSCSASRR